MTQIPKVYRPRLAAWLFDRAIKMRAAAQGLGCSYDSLRRYCLPFEDPERRVPDQTMLERIVAYTSGEITSQDFYPPRLGGRDVEPARLEGVSE